MKLNDNTMFPYPVKGIADNVVSPPTEVEIVDESTPSDYVFRITVTALNDDTIQGLIDEGKAEYLCEVSCSYTMLLSSDVNKTGNFKIVLPRKSVGKRIEFTVTVVAKEPIPNYYNENFHPDFKDQGFVFNLNPGEVIAKIYTFHLDADITSESLKALGSILVVRSHLSDDAKRVEVNCDCEKIEVLLPKMQYNLFKENLAADKRFSSSFHASFVLQALTIAVANYKHYLSLGKLWARILNARFLTQKEDFLDFDLSGDVEVDIEDAYGVAQILLGNPYERMLNSLMELND